MKLSLFGWEFVIMRYRKHNPIQADVSTGLCPSGVYIKREKSFLLAVDKNGNHLGPQVSLTLNDNIDNLSTVTVEYLLAGIYENTEHT